MKKNHQTEPSFGITAFDCQVTVSVGRGSPSLCVSTPPHLPPTSLSQPFLNRWWTLPAARNKQFIVTTVGKQGGQSAKREPDTSCVSPLKKRGAGSSLTRQREQTSVMRQNGHSLSVTKCTLSEQRNRKIGRFKISHWDIWCFLGLPCSHCTRLAHYNSTHEIFSASLPACRLMPSANKSTLRWVWV